MNIITIGTLKGGTGKTSIAFNIAGILAEDKKVLLIDVDPQANLSLNVGIDVTSVGLKTVKELFENKEKLENLIFKNPIKKLPNIDIIPSNIQLTATELNIVSQAGREQILKNFLLDNNEKLSEYDYIIIDTNPSLGIINQNAFLIADKIILVTDISLNGIQGAELFMASWDTVSKQLRKENNVVGLIINNFDRRIKLSKELLEYCKDNDDIKDIIFESYIPNSVKVKEAELQHEPINILHRNSDVHKDFIKLISEIRERGII